MIAVACNSPPRNCRRPVGRPEQGGPFAFGSKNEVPRRTALHACVVLVRLLRKDQHTVRTDGKRCLEGKAVELTRFGDDVAARMTSKVVVIALPIAVETELPGPSGGEADDIAILRLAEKVGDDHNVVGRAALVPTVEGDDLAFVMQVIDLDELPAEAAREAVAVEPQPDEIAVQPDDSAELLNAVIGHDRVWVIYSHSRDGDDVIGGTLSEAYIDAHGFKQFVGIKVRLFEKAGE